MAKCLLSKHVSYGVVELIDTESSWGTRYSVRINGTIRSQSSDWNFIKGEYDRLT